MKTAKEMIEEHLRKYVINKNGNVVKGYFYSQDELRTLLERVIAENTKYRIKNGVRIKTTRYFVEDLDKQFTDTLFK